MKRKWFLIVGLLLLLSLGGMTSAYAFTGRGIPGVEQAGRTVVDTVMTVAGLFAILAIVGLIFSAINHSAGGMIGSFFLVVILIAIALNAEATVRLVAPNALGSTGSAISSPDAWAGLGILLQHLAILSGLTVGLRRLRLRWGSGHGS